MAHDRLGAFVGLKKVMDLKGHKSRVLCLDFSPDLGKMVTASADGEPARGVWCAVVSVSAGLRAGAVLQCTGPFI